MTDTVHLRCVVVDDEEPARWRIRELLLRQSGLELVAECESGASGIEAVRRLRPDLLFLDIQMPEVDGFAFLTQLPPEIVPLTIFVTAFDTYAVRAFDTHSLDYVMKPFSDERLERAIARAREQHGGRQREAWASRVGELVRDLGLLVSRERTAQTASGSQVLPASVTSSEPLSHLLVRSGTRGILLPAADIRWIEAAGVYVQVHGTTATYLHRMPLAELEIRLAAAGFIRIHRSALVNRAALREVVSRAHGDFALVLDDGTRLPVSRRYRATLEAALGQSL